MNKTQDFLPSEGSHCFSKEMCSKPGNKHELFYLERKSAGRQDKGRRTPHRIICPLSMWNLRKGYQWTYLHNCNRVAYAEKLSY